MLSRKQKYMVEVIYRAVDQNITTFKEHLRSLFPTNPDINISEDDAQLQFQKIHAELIDNITDTVYEILLSDRIPRFHNRFLDLPLYPERCGYEDIFQQEHPGLGTIYAIYYYCISGKKASPGSCIFFNHYLADRIDAVIREVAQEAEQMDN